MPPIPQPGGHPLETGDELVRAAFVAMADVVTPLLSHPVLAGGWNGPSALERWTNGDLTAHLVRAVLTVATYLRRDDPGSSEPIDAAGYLIGIEGLTGASGPDLDSDLHRSIHQRARDEATPGHPALLSAWEEGLAAVRVAVRDQAVDRQLSVLGGRAIALDDYLVTRMVELAVHADDLAVSLGIEPPEFEPAHIDHVIGCLVGVARRRHGDLAVLRGLTRTERDRVAALRVL